MNDPKNIQISEVTKMVMGLLHVYLKTEPTILNLRIYLNYIPVSVQEKTVVRRLDLVLPEPKTKVSLQPLKVAEQEMAKVREVAENKTDAIKAEKGEKAKKVLVCLLRNDCLATTAEIAAATDLAKKSVSNALRGLVKSGKVLKHGRGNTTTYSYGHAAPKESAA